MVIFMGYVSFREGTFILIYVMWFQPPLYLKNHESNWKIGSSQVWVVRIRYLQPVVGWPLNTQRIYTHPFVWGWRPKKFAQVQSQVFCKSNIKTSVAEKMLEGTDFFGIFSTREGTSE